MSQAPSDPTGDGQPELGWGLESDLGRDRRPDLGPCPLCGRPLVPGPSVDEHHLVPRSEGGRETVTMHRVCHSKIHSLFTEQELRDSYDTLDKLRAHPEIAKFIRFVRKKHPEYRGRNATSRRKRRR